MSNGNNGFDPDQPVPTTERPLPMQEERSAGGPSTSKRELLPDGFARDFQAAATERHSLEIEQTVHESLNILSWPLLPPSYERQLGHAERIELAGDRRIRERNKINYRLAHWPIWIWVFFIAPGPLTFELFESGFDARMAAWLGVVLLGTGIAGLRGRLPGVEPRPYIIRFTEDRPNPLYRRVCYTLAWSEVVAFAVLNIAGLSLAVATGEWRLREIYEAAYFPIVGAIWLLGAIGMLPRVKRSTQNEGHERRYFYGSVWAVCIAQPVLWLLWKILPRAQTWELVKLLVFIGILAYVGNRARRGLLPRTRPIVPGELAVSD